MRKVGTPATEPAPAAKVEDSIPTDPDANSFAIDREDMRRQVGNDRRGYVWPLNEQNPRVYMGVTSALNAIPKQAIPYWAARTVAETAVENVDVLKDLVEKDPEGAIRWLKGSPWSKRDKAADIGTAVHLIAELDASGDTVEADRILATLDPVGKEKAKQVRAFFASVPCEITLTEGVVYNDEHGYAGTLDFILEFDEPDLINRFPFPESADGRLRVLTDLKTSKGVYSETALQLAAYRHADFVFDMASGERLPMPGTDGAAVLHVTEKSWSLIPVDASADSFEKFLAALDLSQHVPLGKEMVGTPAIKGSAPKPKPIPKGKPKVKSTNPGDFRNL